MTSTLPLLEEFYREKLAAMLRHEAGSRLVSQYDVNNTYQYIIAREDVQLSWVAKAIEELSGAIAQAAEASRTASGKGADLARRISEEDARESLAFVDRWRPRVDAMANARHKKMLGVILGEVLEQRRFFEQALDGRTDLLGRRGQHLEPAHGDVLPSRWIE